MVQTLLLKIALLADALKIDVQKLIKGAILKSLNLTLKPLTQRHGFSKNAFRMMYIAYYY